MNCSAMETGGERVSRTYTDTSLHSTAYIYQLHHSCIIEIVYKAAPMMRVCTLFYVANRIISPNLWHAAPRILCKGHVFVPSPVPSYGSHLLNAPKDLSCFCISISPFSFIKWRGCLTDGTDGVEEFVQNLTWAVEIYATTSDFSVSSLVQLRQLSVFQDDLLCHRK